MALPTTVGGGAFAEGSHFGPFLAPNGAFYVLAKGSGTENIAIYKATDPTSSWSLADEENAGQIIACFAGDMVGSNILLYNAFNQIRINIFDSTTDVIGAAAILNSFTTTSALPRSISPGHRSDNDRIVLIQGEADSIMGTAYQRIDYERWEGTSWTAVVALDAAGSVSWRSPQLVMTSNDRAHMFYTDATNTDLYLTTLLSNNNYGQTGTTTVGRSTQDTTIGSSNNPIGKGCWANSQVWLPYVDASGQASVAHFTDADNPTATIDANVGANAVLANASGVSQLCCVADGNDVHLLYVGSSNSHLYHRKLPAGGSWDTETDEKTLTSIVNFSATVYARGGSNVIGFVWWNGTSLVYDEIALAPPAAPTSFIFPTMASSMVSLLVR